ncbi:hypothetical protein BHS30_29565 [Klebsiella pneumoniae]|nr:hypothetical protein BHS30_29565 [Klebsiella pneumoniae]
MSSSAWLGDAEEVIHAGDPDREGQLQVAAKALGHQTAECHQAPGSATPRRLSTPATRTEKGSCR